MPVTRVPASAQAHTRVPASAQAQQKAVGGRRYPERVGSPPALSQRMHWHKVIGHGAYGNCGATERTEFATREKGNEGEMRTAAESTYSIQHRKRHQQMPFMC